MRLLILLFCFCFFVFFHRGGSGFLCNGTNPLAACSGYLFFYSFIIFSIIFIFFYFLLLTIFFLSHLSLFFLFLFLYFLGSMIETYPRAFPANSTITIRAEYFVVCKEEKGKRKGEREKEKKKER